MKGQYFVIALFLLIPLNYPMYGSANIAQKMQEAHIVPYILDRGPQHQLYMYFENGFNITVPGCNMTDGDLIAHGPITLEWQSIDSHCQHVIIALDLTGSHPLFLLWLLVNVEGNQFRKTGKRIANFYRPHQIPQAGYLILRHVYLIYKQSTKYENIDMPVIATGHDHVPQRQYFPLRNFTETYRLGTPIAGTFFDFINL